MKTRSPMFILGLALGGCLMLLVCAAVVGIGGYVLVNRGSLFASSAPAQTNKIVYLGNDANIYVIDPKSKQKVALTQDGDGDSTHGYHYPTWAPDNRHIAFVGIHYAQGQASAASLYTIGSNGEKRTEVYKSDAEIPFYLYWSPDSHFVGFLSSKGANT